MLNIYLVSIQLCRDVRVIGEHVGRHDRNLLDQLRRAVTSVPLNLAESDGVRGGNRRQRRLTALGSAREKLARVSTWRRRSGTRRWIGPSESDWTTSSACS